MNSAQIATFSTAQINALGTTQLSSLDADHLGAITTAQMASLSTTNLDSLTSAQFVELTTTQIVALTSYQINHLETTDVAALTTTQIHALSANEISALSTDAIHALTTIQYVALSTSQIMALTTAQFAAIETTDIAALTTAQAHALTTAQIVAFTTDQIQGLTTDDIAAMSSTQIAAFEVADIQAMSTAQISAMVSATPIVLDLSGMGIQTTDAAHGVAFDIAATGQATQVGWVGQGNGLLVMDRNGDGVINNGTELFGVASPLANGQRAGNGYNALADLDTNHDGKIGAHDAHFADLKVWVDANHDGKTDPGELKGLVDLGIVELDLSYTTSNRVDHGNGVAMVSSFKTSDGQHHEMADVWFAKAERAKAIPTLGELLADAHTDLVPAQHATPEPAATQIVAAVSQATADTVHSSPSLQHVTIEDELVRHQTPLI